MTRWFAKKEDAGWTAVDVGADGLYGITMLPPSTPGGKPRVIRCGKIEGGKLDAEALTALSQKISVPGCPWILTLNHTEYNIQVVPEPPVPTAELEQSLRWSLSTSIDFPVDEANLGWMRIPTTKYLQNRTPHMYVMLVKKEIITRYNTLFQQARIPLQVIDVHETAQRNIATQTEKSQEGECLLSVSEHGVRLSVTFDGELYLDRFVEASLFSHDMNDADFNTQASERIVLQVQRSLDFVGRNLPFINVNRVLVAPMPCSPDICDFILKNLQVPGEPLDLASIFDFSQTPKLMGERHQALYFFALGAALRFLPKGQQINLQTVKQRHSGSILKKSSILAAPVLLLLSLLGFWGMKLSELTDAREVESISTQQLKEAQARLSALTDGNGKNLDAEISTLTPQAAEAEKILAQTVDLGSAQGYAKHFALLTTISEDGLWLTNISIDKTGRSIVIRGNALRKESVMAYAQKLNSVFAELGVQFTAVELTPVTAGKQNNPGAQLTAVAFKLH